jgi:hypothetical protein
VEEYAAKGYLVFRSSNSSISVEKGETKKFPVQVNGGWVLPEGIQKLLEVTI